MLLPVEHEAKGLDCANDVMDVLVGGTTLELVADGLTKSEIGPPQQARNRPGQVARYARQYPRHC